MLMLSAKHQEKVDSAPSQFEADPSSLCGVAAFDVCSGDPSTTGPYPHVPQV